MRRLPSTDLYFMNACGHRVAKWFRRGPIRALGQNCFAAGDTILLIRRDQDQWMRDLRSHSGRLIYLIDDDIEGAKDSPSLPADYRERLIRFHEEYHQALTERADTLVVTSPALQERFAAHRDVRLLHPAWHLPMADDGHYDEIAQGGLIRSAHLGSGSHAESLEFLRPVIASLLERHEHFHFTYMGHMPALGTLDQHPRVRRQRPLSWPRYRRWIRKQRFHLGIYPLGKTPFDKARSQNKLLEHGVVGAVGVYSDNWFPASELKQQAIVTGENVQDWVDTISATLAAPEILRKLAQQARPTLDRLNDPTTQQRFWGELLDVVI